MESSKAAFKLKKIISRFLFPLPLCIEILLLGLVLLWFTRKQRAGKVVVTVGTLLLLLLSYNGILDNPVKELERRYPSYDPAAQGELSSASPRSPVKWIVVLGGGHKFDSDVPLSSQINNTTLARLVEGIILYRKHPGSKLLVSGGGMDGPVSDGDLMARVAEALGVPREDLVVESQSWDTEDEARFLKPVIQDDPFILVTSASHMFRSMKLFESYGMHPIAAPTDHLVRQGETFSTDSLFPDPGALVEATRLVYEYLGLAWLKIKGRI